jgi:pullulanase/glycogen debranching enzyme
MNWDRMIFNLDMVTYTKRMIALRKDWKAFHIASGVQIQKLVKFTVGDGSTVQYDIDCLDARQHSAAVRVIFNPTREERYFCFDQGYRIIADENGLEQEGKRYEFHVKPLTCLVLSRDIEAD